MKHLWQTNKMSVLHVSEKVIQELYNHGIKADAIVVDLPGKGCDEELLRTIASMMPKKSSMLPATRERNSVSSTIPLICITGTYRGCIFEHNLSPKIGSVELTG